MKNTIAFIVLGIVLGITAVFMVQSLQKMEATSSTEHVDFIEYRVEVPGDVLAITHGFERGIGRAPDTITSLENSAISNMLAFIARIRDKDGNLVGLASELEIFPDDKGVNPDKTWKTDWTVTTPQGTLLMYENERVPAAHLPAFTSVMAGENWTGSIFAQTSVGPHPSGRGVIIGGTGIYAGATGTFVEKIELRGLTTEGGITGTMYLQIYLDKKPDNQ